MFNQDFSCIPNLYLYWCMTHFTDALKHSLFSLNNKTSYPLRSIAFVLCFVWPYYISIVLGTLRYSIPFPLSLHFPCYCSLCCYCVFRCPIAFWCDFLQLVWSIALYCDYYALLFFHLRLLYLIAPITP